MRFGVEDRETAGFVSPGGADGERIAAMDCGDGGIVAVRVLLRPGEQREIE